MSSPYYARAGEGTAASPPGSRQLPAAADDGLELGGARGVEAAQRVVLVLRALAVAGGEVGDAEVVARLREVRAHLDGLLERLDGRRVLFEPEVGVAHQVEVVGVERAPRLVVGADGGRVGGARLLCATQLLLRGRDVVVPPALVRRL